ncbi:DUF1127 domain-containing protein [Celerinatantimonas sp. YJH-8]|uniref:DUF1127 domain-containing protein n=1 Tax=Celerinatantimonas sp. YJH-8 TaxID=3228714 RepID=UPI0038CBE571
MTTQIARVEQRNQTLKSFTLKAVELLNSWHERHRTRQQLASMPDYLLRDIGLTEQDRQQELNKPFWQ